MLKTLKRLFAATSNRVFTVKHCKKIGVICYRKHGNNSTIVGNIQMICSNAGARKTWCDLIAMQHTKKQNCAEYSNVMRQHRSFFWSKHQKQQPIV